jgi:hypothetical protein
MSAAALESTAAGTMARLLKKYPAKTDAKSLAFWQDCYLLMRREYTDQLWEIRSREPLNRLESAARRHGDRDLLACYQRAVDQVNTEVECGTLLSADRSPSVEWVAAVAFDIAMHGAKKGSPFA